MAGTRISVTLDAGQLKQIRKLTGRKRGAVPDFVRKAIGDALTSKRDWLDEAMERTGGPLTDEERAWVDSLLEPEAPKRSGRRRKAA